MTRAIFRQGLDVRDDKYCQYVRASAPDQYVKVCLLRKPLGDRRRLLLPCPTLPPPHPPALRCPVSPQRQCVTYIQTLQAGRALRRTLAGKLPARLPACLPASLLVSLPACLDADSARGAWHAALRCTRA